MSATFDIAIIVSIAAGILCLLIVGVVLKRRGFREQTARLLVLYVTALCVWELGRAFLHLGWLAFLTDAVTVQVATCGLLVLSLLFLHLSRSFLRLEGAGYGWWALGAGWITTLVVLDSELLVLPNVLWINSERLTYIGWGIFMSGATILTMMSYHRTRQPLHRNRITHWSLTLSLTIAGAALFLAGHEPVSSGFYLLGALGATYVVLTHRLPDVRQAARRAVNHLIVTLLTALVYAAGLITTYYLSQTQTPVAPGYDPILIGAVLALVLAVFFDPLLRLTQRWVNRLIGGGSRDPSRTLREYSTSISNILDLERLSGVAVGLISEALEIQHGALFVVHREEEKIEGKEDCFHLRGLRGMGAGDLPPGTLSAKNPVAEYLYREHSPLTQYDVDLHPRFQDKEQVKGQESYPAERDWLASLDMDVYVPIYAKDEWIGLLALGPKLSGDRYFEDELVLLGTLADQTAVALENARLFDDLKARNVEIERLNDDLAAANCELSRLGRAKSDFISIASHELRTPLTQVCGYTDIMKEMLDGSLSPDMGEQLIQGLKEAAWHLEEIVDTMFDVTQIDTETLALNVSRDSIASIVGTAVDTWASALEERKQTLTLEDLADLPPITADYRRLEQVFSHLIQNAIKFTPDGGQIRITGRMLEWTLPQDQFIEVVVADTGIGIDPEDLERIFEKFSRVGDVLLHSTGKTKFKGAGPGLGLTIARGIVEAHGGRIWAESPGYDEETYPGGEFHVTLPVHRKSDYDTLSSDFNLSTSYTGSGWL